MTSEADRTVTSIASAGQAESPSAGGGGLLLLAEGVELGPYKVVRLLGRGGMGAVYEATHRTLGKRVAIKTLLPEFAVRADLRARFVREGQAASKIRHPNVVDVYDVGVQGDTPYLIMEFLEGEDLGKLLGREGALDIGRAADIMIPALCALAAAHSLGVIHRDLKPDNIFLAAGRGGAVDPKLVDFGISKLVEDESASGLTGTSALMGTPHYMSPEQAQSAKTTDARSDQFSAAVILYQAVVGQRPFSGDALYAILAAIVAGNFPKPTSIKAELPVEIDELILRAMSRAPADRFPDVRHLARGLLPFASERVRLTYKGEVFGEGNSVPPPNLVVSPAESLAEPMGTTIGSSVTTRPSNVTSPRSNTRMLIAAGSATVLLTAVGAIWYARSQPIQPDAASVAPSAVAVPAPSESPSSTTPSAIFSVVEPEPAASAMDDASPDAAVAAPSAPPPPKPRGAGIPRPPSLAPR